MEGPIKDALELIEKRLFGKKENIRVKRKHNW
jgi:hypothetical protein